MKYRALLFLFLIMISCEVLPTVHRGNSAPNTSTARNERSEFKELLAKDQIDKKHVNAEVLTYLLNETDPSDKNTAAVIENASNCDLILRVVGISNEMIYNLPVAAGTKNQFVVRKGSYTLKANICGAAYYSQKEIVNPLILKLSAR